MNPSPPRTPGTLRGAGPLLVVLGLVAQLLLADGAPAAVKTGDDASDYFEDGLARYNQKDYAGAVVQLKNALQQDAQHLPTRILLGHAYLRLGQGAAAEKELTLAQHLGADANAVAVPLGDALLLQRKYQDILDRIRADDPFQPASAEVLTFRGRAHLELGQLDDAQKDFDNAVALNRNRHEPLLGLAQIALSRGQLDAAEGLIDRAAAIAPENSEVWFRKGEIRQLLHDREGALAQYNRALALNGSHARARLARARVFYELGDFKASLADASAVRALSDRDPMAAFLAAQAAVRLGDMTTAKEAMEAARESISSVSDEFLYKDPPRLQIAGIVNYMMGDLERANNYLSQLLRIQPHNPAVRQLLGQLQLQLNEPESAIHTLYPLYQADRADPDVLGLLGEAYLKVGRYMEATNAFERAAELAPDQEKLRTQLALSRLGAGQDQQAIVDLERAVALGRDTAQSAMLLALVQMNAHDYAAALKTTDDLKSHAPDNPAVHNLIGAVHLRANEFGAARQAFEEALRHSPDFEPAQYNLARMDLQAGNIRGAEQRYAKILERKPRAGYALIGMSDVALAEGRKSDAVTWLKKAGGAPGDTLESRLKLVDLYLQLEDYPNAAYVAAELSQRYPEDAEVVEAVARTQAATGKRDDAILSYRRAVRYSGFSGAQLIAVARGQVGLEDYEGARYTLKKAMHSDMARTAGNALARLEIITGNYAAARTAIAEIRTRAPASADGDVLSGELALRQERYDDAIAAYEKALQMENRSDVVLGLHRAQWAAKRPDAAIATLESWATNQPRDLAVRKALALAYVAVSRLPEAQTLHEKLLTETPEDAVLVANLARIYQLRKDSRARETAAAALLLKPDWSVAMDTLGWILVEQGETEKGLRLLRDSLSRDTNPLTRYHLAVALKQLGRFDEARHEVASILQDDRAVDWIDEVRKLERELAVQ